MSQRQARRESFFREDSWESLDSEESYDSGYGRGRHSDWEEASGARRGAEYGDSHDYDNYSRRQRDWQEAGGARRTHFRSRREDHSPGDSSAFQVRASRKRIKPHELYKLRRGDHIGWHRPYIIWHHAIVVEVDVENKRVKVIHYGKNNERDEEIVQEWLDVEDQWGEMYLFEYPEEIILANSPDDVIERAESKLGEQGYKFLKNNCEHFATYCKTGNASCKQVSWLRKKIVEAVDSALYYGGRILVAELLEDIIYDTDIFGAAVVALLETGFCLYDIWQMNKKRKSGDISDTDFKVCATQRVGEAVGGAGCAIVGGMIGGAIGSVVPVAGTFIGSVVGGGIGCLIGKAVGAMAGHWLGVKLWDS